MGQVSCCLIISLRLSFKCAASSTVGLWIFPSGPRRALLGWRAGQAGPVGQLSVLGSTVRTVDGRQSLPMGPRRLLPVQRRGGERGGILTRAFSRSSRISIRGCWLRK